MSLYSPEFRARVAAKANDVFEEEVLLLQKRAKIEAIMRKQAQERLVAQERAQKVLDLAAEIATTASEAVPVDATLFRVKDRLFTGGRKPVMQVWDLRLSHTPGIGTTDAEGNRRYSAGYTYATALGRDGKIYHYGYGYNPDEPHEEILNDTEYLVETTERLVQNPAAIDLLENDLVTFVVKNGL